MRLNYDHTFRCLRESREVFEALLFPKLVGAGETWLFGGRFSAELKSHAGALGIEFRECRPRPGSSRSGRVRTAARLRSAAVLCEWLWPGNVGALQGTTCFGVAGGATRSFEEVCAGDAAYEPEIRSLDTEDERVQLQGGLGPDKLFSVRFDPASFDSGDPIYTMQSELASRFETGLTALLRENGYEMHALPFLDPLVWNWVGYGEIPILDHESGQSIP